MTTAQNSPFVNEAVYWPIQLLNTVNDFLQRHVGVAPLKLNRKNLAQLTRVERVHDAFGSQEQFHQLFAAFFDEFAGNPQLSAMAILGIMNWATSCFRARKECMEYVAAHPEVLKQQIEKPLVIMGMHRTGSTLLFNLMHQDETTRCAFMYEMAGDWPHLPAATSRAAHYTDYRMALLKRLLTLGRKIWLCTGLCGSVGESQCSDEGFDHTPRGARGAPLKGVWTKVADSSTKGSAFCYRCT